MEENICSTDEKGNTEEKVGPFGVAQWFGLGTSMLEVSSSKPLASESKGFAFWVELVAPGLPGAVTSPMWFASYCIGAGFYPVRTQKGSGCGFPLSLKKLKISSEKK